MRDTIIFYINGTRYEINHKDAFKSLSDYLRYDLGKTGTKVVCAEGDCGACTVLVASGRDKEKGKLYYRSINSCITFLHLMDLHSIITVEGISKDNELHPVQTAMRENHGAQCGYCTPGFICAMAGMTDDLKKKDQSITKKGTKNYLTGNLCRCTGYEPILTAALSTDLSKVSPLYDRYHNQDMINEFENLQNQTLKIKTDHYELFLPSQIDEAIQLLGEKEIKIISGATDIGVQINKGLYERNKVLSLYRIQEMEKIEKVKDEFHVGATATWTEIEKAFESDIPEYSRLLHLFASPQIKNTGTLVGNIANASPIADGIPFLMVCGASVVLLSLRGERTVLLTQFYKGYKELDLEKDELIKKVIIPIPSREHFLKLYKVSLRKDLDISAVTFACKTQIENNHIKNIKLAYGGVGPVIKRLEKTEQFLENKPWNEKTIKEGMDLLEKEISPISDLRGSAQFRTQISKNLLMKFFIEHQTQQNAGQGKII